MAYKVATAPVLLPFTVAYVKTWLKIPASVTAEDTIVENLIKAAAETAESITKRALLTQTIEEYYDGWAEYGEFMLSVAPVQSVTSVTYLAGGTYTTWDASNYSVDNISEPCRVVAKSNSGLPSFDMSVPNVIKITYVAGATSASGIPQKTVMGMLNEIAFRYENREDMPYGGSNSNRQRSANALFMRDRML